MDSTATVNVTKAPSVTAVNKSTKWTTGAASVAVETSVAHAYGKHPSTVCYGFTVTKLTTTEVENDTKKWINAQSTSTSLPFKVSVKRNQPLTVALAPNSKKDGFASASVKVVVGSGKFNAKAFAVDAASAAISKSEEDKNNKNERISGHYNVVNATEKIQVAHAFIVQTAEHTYKTIPKTYLEGAKADLKYAKKVAKDTLRWVISAQNVSADGKETTTGVELTYTLDAASLCQEVFDSADSKATGDAAKTTCWVNQAGGYILTPGNKKVSLVAPAKDTEGKVDVSGALTKDKAGKLTYTVTFAGKTLNKKDTQAHAVFEVNYGDASAAEVSATNAEQKKKDEAAEKQKADKAAKEKKDAADAAGEETGANATFVQAILVALFM